MIKKIVIAIFATILVIGLLMGAVYVGFSFYYSDTFSQGVFINGNYVTGLSVEQVNEILVASTPISNFTMIDKKGNSQEIVLSDIGYSIDYLDEIRKIKENDNPFFWLFSVGEMKEYEISPAVHFDEQKLDNLLAKSKLLIEKKDINSIQVEMKQTEDGFVFIDETQYLIDYDKAVDTIGKSIQESKNSVNLEEQGCYKAFTYTDEMKNEFELWKKVNHYQSMVIEYQFGEDKEVLDKKTLAKWIVLDEFKEPLLDEKGDLTLDEKQMEEFVMSLCDKYDTVKKERKLLATRGEIVTVPPGSYGNKIDEKKEIEFLLNAVKEKRSLVHEPAYSQKAWATGLDDIGDTYIEVDLTTQKLYYHYEGEIVVESPIVTGNISQGNSTPAKACYVYFKQKNRILRGEDYATPVKYWMAVTGRIGIHDANWRSKFGGQIYKTAGSHGCINTPIVNVKVLYDKVEIGTPVMIFH